MNNKYLPLIIGIVLILIGAGAFLLLRGTASQNQEIKEPQMMELEETATLEENEVVESEMVANESMVEDTVMEDATKIEISAKEFSFTPTTLNVKAGQKVSLTLTNNGEMTHDWVLEGVSGARTKLTGSGETDTIEFTIDEPGDYTFYCSVAGHRQAGMEGVLTVE